MQPVLTVIDDFTPDAEQIRRDVLSAGFSEHIGPDNLKYTGICSLEAPSLYRLIAAVLGQPIVPRLSCFRLNLAGETPHSWVHADDICARFASVLYLNPPEQCAGGTAFWRHTGLRINQMPSAAELGSLGIDATRFCEMMKKEWQRLEPWEQSGFVGMKWNRFLTYPTSVFHSRYPFEGFGTGPADGRLIWVCFYDLANAPTTVAATALPDKEPIHV